MSRTVRAHTAGAAVQKIAGHVLTADELQQAYISSDFHQTALVCTCTMFHRTDAPPSAQGQVGRD